MRPVGHGLPAWQGSASNVGRQAAEGSEVAPLWLLWGLGATLRRAGMLEVSKNGRIHRYDVNLDAPLRLRIVKSGTLRDILGQLVEQASPCT